MFHDPIDGSKVGEHRLLIRLLKGVFNKRPPARKEVPGWDLAVVLKGLRKPPFEPLKSAPMKFVSWKAAFLTAICTAARSSDLHRFGHAPPHLRFKDKQGSVVLTPRTLKKQCRPGHSFKESTLVKFGEDRKLDPVRAIKIYLERVASRRGSTPNLFLTIGKDGKPASSQTLAKWLSSTISQTFESEQKTLSGPHNAHTLRAVSTSMAKLKGVSPQAILDAADWSSESTFARFYLKEVTSERASFSRAVLEEGL